MDKLNYGIIDAIHDINEAVSDSRESVLDKYNDIFEKQTMILENYYDIDFENQFDIFQEAKTKNVNVDGLSAFKFDNHLLLEAIRLMNEAFKDVLKDLKDYKGKNIPDFRKNLSENNFEKLYKHEKFKEAINCIEQQFDCKIRTNRFFGVIIGTATTLSGVRFQFNKITVSKTQGFRLGGQMITLLIGNEPTMYMPKDENLFGQYCCSIYLHEIFHNIYAKLHMSNINAVATTQMFLDTLKKCCTEQQVVECCEHYTETMHKQLKIKMSNKNKGVLVKQLAVLCITKLFSKESYKKDPQLFDVDDVEANDINDKDINDNRKQYIKFEKDLKLNTTSTKFKHLFGLIVNIVCGGDTVYTMIKNSNSCNIFNILLTIIFIKTLFVNFKNLTFVGKDGKTKKNSREEHYCDLFSGMYGLPVTFRYFFRKGKVSTTANKLTDEQLKAVYDIERIVEDYDPHPTATCRNYAGYQIAKQFINNKNIAPEIHDYCKWVIDNFSSTEKLDIEHNHNSRIFNPEEAKSIDRHLKNIVLDNQKKITVTEYDTSWIGCIDESEIVFE